MGTKLMVEVFGYVPRTFVERVVSTLSELYKAAGGPPLIDLWVYSTVVEKREAMEREALRAGVAVVGNFVVSHEAWSGLPRVHVCYESLRKLDLGVARALLMHEAAHSVLHGTAAHYVASVSSRALEKLGLRRAAEAAYMLSTAVKDFEVAKLLLSKGFRKELLTYIDFTLSQRADLGSDFLNALQFIKVLAPIAALKRGEAKLYTSYTKRLSEWHIKTPVDKIAELVAEVCKLEASVGDKVSALLDRLIDDGLPL